VGKVIDLLLLIDLILMASVYVYLKDKNIDLDDFDAFTKIGSIIHKEIKKYFMEIGNVNESDIVIPSINYIPLKNNSGYQVSIKKIKHKKCGNSCDEKDSEEFITFNHLDIANMLVGVFNDEVDYTAKIGPCNKIDRW